MDVVVNDTNIFIDLILLPLTLIYVCFVYFKV